MMTFGLSAASLITASVIFDNIGKRPGKGRKKRIGTPSKNCFTFLLSSVTKQVHDTFTIFLPIDSCQKIQQSLLHDPTADMLILQ